MTHITIRVTSTGEYKGFTCIGHANYAAFSKDVVCAAVSVLVINTINSMEELAGEKMDLITNETNGLIDCRFQHSIGHDSKLLMDSMVLGLKEIVKQYHSKYVELKFEEV